MTYPIQHARFACSSFSRLVWRATYLELIMRKAGAAAIVFVLSMSMTALPAAAYVFHAAGNPVPVEDVNTSLPPDACSDANAQATQDQNATLWLLGGCVGGALVVLAAYVLEANPPATALLGKDEAYVAEYTDCYQEAAKKIRTKKSLTGCLIGTAAGLLIYAIVVATAVDNGLYYYN